MMKAHLLSLVALLLVGACNACGASSSAGGGRSEVPKALAEYDSKGYEVRRLDYPQVRGLTLYAVARVGINDLAPSFTVGVDAAGHKVEGFALFQRSLPLPPEEMAARVRAFMMSGGSIAHPNEPSTFATPQELALVHEPKVDGDKLVFFMWQGEMHPFLEQVQVDLRSGAIDRVPVSRLVNRP